ncbi:MAG: hypothetical protein RL153_2493, partial [Verrucomicrobiota bacterium]
MVTVGRQGVGPRGGGWRPWMVLWVLAWLVGGWGGRAMALGVRME